MLWFNLSEQQNPTQPGRDGGEKEKGRRVRDLMD